MQRLRGNICYRPKRRKEGAAMLPPRPADTYRGARRHAARGDPRSLLMKEERLLTGESRRAMDRRRHKALMERLST